MNNSAAVSDELLRGHVSLCVIGLPANDYKVSNWLGRDVIRASVSEVDRSLDENSPANPPLLRANDKKDAEADLGNQSE